MAGVEEARKRLEEYIRRQVGEAPVYLKSKHVAKELDDVTAKQVGKHLAQLAKDEWEVDGYTVENWGSSTSGTTWKAVEVTEA